MSDSNLINMQKPINSSHLQGYSNINNNNKNSINQTNSNTNKNNSIVLVMKEMKTKISNNDYNAIKELLKNSKITLQQSKNKLLNLSFSIYNSTNNRIQRKIIMELINYGADPNQKLKLLETNDKSKMNNSLVLSNSKIKLNPLAFCCIKGDFELYELLKNKVNLSTDTDNNNINSIKLNKNYFFYFFENGLNIDNKYKIAEDILTNMKKKFNISINDYDKITGKTLLMVSVIKQYKNFIKLFIDNGADINLKNIKDGNTALHYAALVKNKDIIDLLLKSDKCNLLIKNNNNDTCVDIANKNNNTEIYELLAGKYIEQQKLFEEKKAEEVENNNEYNINIGLNNINMYKEYLRNNNLENTSLNEYEEGIDIIKKNQTVKNNIEASS